MASNTEKDKFASFQGQILWIALACFAASFYLDSPSGKEMFGTVWLMVKQANAVIMWLGAVLSGKRFIDLLERFKKITEESKINSEENNSNT